MTKKSDEGEQKRHSVQRIKESQLEIIRSAIKKSKGNKEAAFEALQEEIDEQTAALRELQETLYKLDERKRRKKS